jgi:hypothetical protein
MFRACPISPASQTLHPRIMPHQFTKIKFPITEQKALFIIAQNKLAVLMRDLLIFNKFSLNFVSG